MELVSAVPDGPSGPTPRELPAPGELLDRVFELQRAAAARGRGGLCSWWRRRDRPPSAGWPSLDRERVPGERRSGDRIPLSTPCLTAGIAHGPTVQLIDVSAAGFRVAVGLPSRLGSSLRLHVYERERPERRYLFTAAVPGPTTGTPSVGCA